MLETIGYQFTTTIQFYNYNLQQAIDNIFKVDCLTRKLNSFDTKEEEA